jgi:hypothetical protein
MFGLKQVLCRKRKEGNLHVKTPNINTEIHGKERMGGNMINDKMKRLHDVLLLLRDAGRRNKSRSLQLETAKKQVKITSVRNITLLPAQLPNWLETMLQNLTQVSLGKHADGSKMGHPKASGHFRSNLNSRYKFIF